MAEEAHHQHMKEVMTEMVEETPQLHQPKTDECDNNTIKIHNHSGVETEDRGLFGKKEENKPEDEMISQTETKVEEEKKHGGLFDKFHRSDSSSSSSDEEEVEDGGEKKKKKKGLKGKIEEKISGDHKDDIVLTEPAIEPQEKKGLLDKIKDKLPGHNKDKEIPPPSVTASASECTTIDGEPKDSKGILEKIKENLPGYHPKNEEYKKESEK